MQGLTVNNATAAFIQTRVHAISLPIGCFGVFSKGFLKMHRSIPDRNHWLNQKLLLSSLRF